jgi:hypothetical protein
MTLYGIITSNKFIFESHKILTYSSGLLVFYREHPENTIMAYMSYLESLSTGLTLELIPRQNINTSVQLLSIEPIIGPDNYNKTWEKLPMELFRDIFYRYFPVLNNKDPNRLISPLLTVCKKMTLKVLQELCRVICWYPNAKNSQMLRKMTNLYNTRRVYILYNARRVYMPLPLCRMHISYTSSWWPGFESSFPIDCFIIDLTQVMYSKQLLDRWKLKNLDTLVITSGALDQIEEVTPSPPEIRDTPLCVELLELYQLILSKQIVLCNINITCEIWEYFNPDLEIIELIDCWSASPLHIDLKKFKSLQQLSFELSPPSTEDNAFCKPYLDLTKCTISFPETSERWKLKDNVTFKLL